MVSTCMRGAVISTSVLKVIRPPHVRTWHTVPTLLTIINARIRELDRRKGLTMAIRNNLLFIAPFLLSNIGVCAQRVDYSVTSVPQEEKYELTQITTDEDEVCMPIVERSNSTVNWFTNRIIGVSHDGKHLAFISAKDGKTNIFVKDLDGNGTTIQRTKRYSVIDFSYSQDGKEICFTEKNGSTNSIFTTSSAQGFVCRQITTGHQDYTPIYSSDMSQIYFVRTENEVADIWSYDLSKNFVSSHTSGINPCIEGKDTLLVVRKGISNNHEIWRIDTKSGIEECVLSDANCSFSTPSLSPDGKWILMVGTGKLDVNGANQRNDDVFSVTAARDHFNMYNTSIGNNGKSKFYHNTDIYVCRSDGSQLIQLTYHAADDLSPAWSKDGKYFYFISQRGSKQGKANVWRMTFTY